MRINIAAKLRGKASHLFKVLLFTKSNKSKNSKT